jgi:hypothetical protein
MTFVQQQPTTRARPRPKVGLRHPGAGERRRPHGVVKWLRAPTSSSWWPDGPFPESTGGKSVSGNEVSPDALTLRVTISAISFV